jgi:hypothetical protein
VKLPMRVQRWLCFWLGHAPVDGPPIRHCRRCGQVRNLPD